MSHPSGGYNHTNNPNGGGKAGGNKGIALSRRLARRAEAETRARERAERSDEAQLVRLDTRPGAAAKERRRLTSA